MPQSFYVWYRSWTPDGKLWCSTEDSAEFIEYNARWTGEGELTSEKTISARPVAFSTD